jgi:hypothetical protein
MWTFFFGLSTMCGARQRQIRSCNLSLKYWLSYNYYITQPVKRQSLVRQAHHKRFDKPFDPSTLLRAGSAQDKLAKSGSAGGYATIFLL